MFGFWRKQAAVPPTTNDLALSSWLVDQTCAPGTHISYDPQLVDKLKHDHQELEHLFIAIIQAGNQMQVQNIKPLMQRFHVLFNNHVLQEYIKLYVYLDTIFRDEPERQYTIRQCRREMRHIGKAVRGFLHKWEESPITLDEVPQFLKEAQRIGVVLGKRFKMEEAKLFEIYKLYPKMAQEHAGLSLSN